MILKFLFIFLLCFISNVIIADITVEPQSVVRSGTSVNFTCIFENSHTILWQHNNKNIGEDDSVYDNKLYSITVYNKIKYVLTVKKVNLNHSGIWSCKEANKDESTIKLTVTAPWNFNSKIKVRKFNTSENRKKPLETGDKHLPYSLLNNEALELTCDTECGFPAPKYISMKYKNMSKPNKLVGGTQKLINCTSHNLKKMTYRVNISCSQDYLVGRNELYCETKNLAGDSVTTKTVYVLCPSKHHYNTLTRGELIAIIVALVLAIFDVVAIVLMLRQNFRYRNSRKLRLKSQKTPSEIML